MDNETSKSPCFLIERLDPSWYDHAIRFLEEVFYQEQHIPKELIPLKNDLQMWWGVKEDDRIVGIVAAWEEASEWHWGRLAIASSLRGRGVGMQLIIRSLTEVFESGVDKVIIEARDVTVEIISKLGGTVIGPKTTFYGTVTPMELQCKDFKLYMDRTK
ncbi:GNAT family N-acetyltransferase [Reichenbachiella agarivorans]|uniref:GNAT family N-acetyltransferase n=1 Tax=Reichenbachiella agarivorans TaxID=2979464 RepID=A0ABY6CW58_9BACT|nr:GNAT family N-acetyltransferase [Reichenbachiella agarivorans]UXP32490.1 GNAT family N-acetyltransferase [Reichenbachiella agarivorans]